MENVIGFASDGCKVMMNEYNSIYSRFKELCPGILTMKCICHSLTYVAAMLAKIFQELAKIWLELFIIFSR